MGTLDLYPCAVDQAIDGTPAVYYRKARVLTRDGQVRVWTAGPAGGLALAVDTTAVEIERLRGDRRYRIATPDGVLDVSPAGGCGCGSPLKRMSVDKAWA